MNKKADLIKKRLVLLSVNDDCISLLSFLELTFSLFPSP